MSVRRALRWLGRGLLGLAVLLAIGTGGGYWWLRQSLPQVDGEIVVASPSAPVTIVRDQWAIPRIEAKSLLDATFALGFVHAQDRLWQMEFQRRLGAGRLAEVVGGQALPADRYMRTLGLYRRAEASLAYLEPQTIAWLEAYADGVNDFLATRSGPLPPEFLILGHDELEPWRPADSLVWIRMMAIDLSVNYRDELLRTRLAKVLSDEQIADVWPDYPEDAPTTLTELARGLDLDALAAVLPPAVPRGVGSNGWVMAGSRTTTGAPLLANDPHLGLRAPGVWYLARLETPDLEVVGTTFPGMPGVVLGHNGHTAWGFTNTGPDTQDLFIERIDPAEPTRYLTPDGPVPFETRTETIRVKDAPPVALTLRASRHGPILSDLMPDAARMFGDDVAVALAWTALAADDITLQAILKLNLARDWDGFVIAARDVGAPMQNILYADTAGHIGFIAPGRVPVRKAGDGRWPVPGWSGAYDWEGWVPFEALPRALDPPGGDVVNANNRVVPEDYPYFLTADWEAPYRARRLAQLLTGDAFGPDDFAVVQADQRSLLAEDLLPVMLETAPAGPAASEAMAALRAWDRVMRADAPEPLIFAAWYRELSRLVYADELGELFYNFWDVRPRFMDHVLRNRPVWCDDVATTATETCAELAARALDLALADLEERFGGDPAGWRWGEAHPARMGHGILEDLPVLGRLFNVEVPSGGDNTTVNVGHFSPRNERRPFANTHAASLRAIYDLADLEGSSFVIATGQSGHPLSPHYRDLTALWARGESVTIGRAADLTEHPLGRLRLCPEG